MSAIRYHVHEDLKEAGTVAGNHEGHVTINRFAEGQHPSGCPLTSQISVRCYIGDGNQGAEMALRTAAFIVRACQMADAGGLTP